jgi:transposase
MSDPKVSIGLDVHKATIAIALAEPGRNGEVRFIGNFTNNPAAIIAQLKRIAERHGEIECAYEAGPCGYALYRRLVAAGIGCIVVAPSKLPKINGRVKNDHRDAIALARLLRSGDLVGVWVPDPTHEAMRDLVRARQAASFDVRKARQRVQSYLLLRDRHYVGKAWGYRHRIWMSDQQFEHRAQQIAFQGYVNALEQAEDRRCQLDAQIAELLPDWSLAPVVLALQSLRGVASVIAISLVAEIGDFGRFDCPRRLMAYLGLVPGEHSSGGSVRPRGITKQGNIMLRSLLFEAAWSYRQGAKVGQWMKTRMPKGMPQFALDIAWKAQLRLCGRYRKLVARGKKSQVAITAVARELLGFVWAIAKAVPGPAQTTTNVPA